jgi:O-antigen/teichoic acid export membrane protein
MLNTVRSSLKNSIVYGLGNVAVKLIGFLLIPLYTDPKFFSVDDFGFIGLLDISGLVLIAFLGSSLPQSLNRWYWDKDHLGKQKTVFFMTLLMQILISVSFCLLLMPLARNFSAIILHTPDYGHIINLVIISAGLQAVNTIISTLMRLQSKSVLYTVTNLVKLVVVLTLTIYLIVFRKMGVEGIYLAQVIGNIFFIVILLGYTFKNITVSFDRALAKAMLIFGLPLLLANISGVALNVIDRYSLNSMDLMKYVALYTLAFKISSVLKLVIVDSIKMAVTPMIIQKINAPDNMRFYSKILLYSSFVLMLGIISVSLFSFELIKVMAKSNQYWEAYIIIPILCLSVFFVNLKDISTNGLFIVKKTRILGSIVFIASTLSLFLNLIFIPLWGIVGAAMATLTAQLLYWLITYFYSQKEFHIPYEIRKIIIILVVGGILSCAGLVINDLSLALRIIIKSACIVSFPFILALFNFYEPVELQAIRGFVVKWSDLKRFGANIRSFKAIKDDI